MCGDAILEKRSPNSAGLALKTCHWTGFLIKVEIGIQIRNFHQILQNFVCLFEEICSKRTCDSEFILVE